MNKRRIGSEMEQLAAKWLAENGYIIEELNYRCRAGEIDIVAREGQYLVFVEVKYRQDFRNGPSFAAVSFYKQKKISEVAIWYLTEHNLPADTACRFDVIGIDGDILKLQKNAFPFRGNSF